MNYISMYYITLCFSKGQANMQIRRFKVHVIRYRQQVNGQIEIFLR